MGEPAAKGVILEWLTRLFQSIPNQPTIEPEASASQTASLNEVQTPVKE